MIKPYALILAILLTSQFGKTARADDDPISARMRECAAGLVPNELHTAVTSSYDEQLRDALCGTWFEAHKNEVEGGGDVSVMMVSASGSGSTKTASVKRTEYCRRTDLKIATSFASSFFYRFTTDHARDAWATCVRGVLSHAPGAAVDLSSTAAGTEIVVQAKWDQNTQPVQPVISLVESINLTCNGPNSKPGTRIINKGQGTSFRCKWQNSIATKGIVVVHTKASGDFASEISRDIEPRGTVTLDLTRSERQLKEEKAWCGGEQLTPELNDQKCDHGKGCVCRPDPKWCWKPNDLRVDAPPGWSLAKPVSVACALDNDGACGWNSLNSPDRTWVVEQDATHAVVRILTNSRSVHVKLCGTAQRFELAPVTAHASTWSLHDGASFVVDVPDGSTGILQGKLDGGDLVLKGGDSTTDLVAGKPVTTPGHTYLTYRLIPAAGAAKRARLNR